MYESFGSEYQESFPVGEEPHGQPLDLSIVRNQGTEARDDAGEYALPITAGAHRTGRPILDGDVAASTPYVEPPVASVTPASVIPEAPHLRDQGPADEALQIRGRLPADYDRKSRDPEQGPEEPPAETGGGGGDGPTDNPPQRGGELPDDPESEDSSGDEATAVHSPHRGRPIIEYDETPAATQPAPEPRANEPADTVPGTASDTSDSNVSPAETGGALPVLSPEAQAAMAKDTEFRDEPILEVTRLDDGRYEITTDKRTLSDGESEVHTRFAYEAVDGVPPEVGETARFYGEKWGEVRGFAVGDRVYRYKPALSPEELAAERAAATFEAEAEETFNEADYDLRALQLPRPLQDNIAAHKAKYPDFLTGGGMRGLVKASENVIRLVDALGGSTEALEEFTAMTYEQRLEAQPWLDTGAYTERSRAILDYECSLAAWYLEQRDQEEQ